MRTEHIKLGNFGGYVLEVPTNDNEKWNSDADFALYFVSEQLKGMDATLASNMQQMIVKDRQIARLKKKKSDTKEVATLKKIIDVHKEHKEFVDKWVNTMQQRFS